jgi:hypothetical protein
MSYVVIRRSVEIEVRIAFGAEPRPVIRIVLAESGVLLLAIGVVINNETEIR